MAIDRPAPGETVLITVEAGVRYVTGFETASAQIETEDGDLVFIFVADDGRIVFLDFAQFAETILVQIGGLNIPGELLVELAILFADEPFSLDSALTVILGGGGNVYSDDLGGRIDFLGAQDVIPGRSGDGRGLSLDLASSLFDPEEEPDRSLEPDPEETRAAPRAALRFSANVNAFGEDSGTSSTVAPPPVGAASLASEVEMLVVGDLVFSATPGTETS